jgi:hypothetical protein
VEKSRSREKNRIEREQRFKRNYDEDSYSKNDKGKKGFYDSKYKGETAEESYRKTKICPQFERVTRA